MCEVPQGSATFQPLACSGRRSTQSAALPYVQHKGYSGERVRWMTALAWISCSAQTTGAQNRVNVVERAASGSSYHVPLPARHELACAQRQPRSVRRAMIARRARRALGLGRWALGDSGLRRPGPGFVIIIHSLPLMSGPQSNLISDIHEIGTLFTTHPHKNQRRERQRERGAGAGGAPGRPRVARPRLPFTRARS